MHGMSRSSARKRKGQKRSGPAALLLDLLLLAGQQADARSLAGSLVHRGGHESAPLPTDELPLTAFSSQQQGKKSRVPRQLGIALSGALACSATHCMVVPLDVIKTRMQTDATGCAGTMMTAAAAVLRDAPGRGLQRLMAFGNGLPPTALGYFMQGATKFGGYEFCKLHAYARLDAAGGERLRRKWQLPVMLLSAASAEMAATVLLAPLEVLKLRVQTDPISAAQGLRRTLMHIARHEGLGSLYVGLAPIAMRQLPYTVTKLVAYELVSRATQQVAQRREWLRPYAVVTAGLIAGAAAAVVSHPADLLLTRLCGTVAIGGVPNVAECVLSDGLFVQIRYLLSLGLGGMYSGLVPRLIMTSAMTSIQFSLYESVRSALGVSRQPLPPTQVRIPA